MSASLGRGEHLLDEKEDSMAANALSVEDDLKKLLEGEAKRRHEFSDNLLSLLSRRRRELREKETGGDEATVPDLVKRVEDADAVATSLLQECQSLCLEDVNKREKDKRDSGYSPSPTTSGDIGDAKRQGVFLPDVAAAPPDEGFPEMPGNQHSIDCDLQALSLALPRVAVQHSDDTTADSEHDSKA